MKPLLTIAALILLFGFFNDLAHAQNVRELSAREIKSLGVSGDLHMLGYISIDATKQGKLKGDDPALLAKSEFVDFNYSISSPTDAVTGLVSGKVKHGPVTIVKRNGYSTPQLFQALTTNELLKSVLIEFVKTRSDGTKAIYYSVKLINARIIRMSHRTNMDDANFKPGSLPLDEITFVYQKIEITHQEGNTMATGDND